MTAAIRPAVRGDSAGAAAVVRAVFEEYGFTWQPGGYHADLMDLDAGYLARGDRFFVATDAAGAIVGTVAVSLERRTRLDGGDCSLERLYVHPDARRRGLGAALLATAVTAARADGRRRMEIWSDKRFREAHRLYERAGAVVVADRIAADPDVSPEWGLVLPLGEPAG